MRPKPVLLLILDGWGHRNERADNAIALANAPNWHRLLAECPHTLIHTSGLEVGLPEGQMGNSEVGHMNLGAGRVVYQELTRIDKAIRDGEFFENPELVAACDAVIGPACGCLHVFGLLSPGGVHSHEAHIFAMLELARRRGVRRIAVHAFLDGRDMPPRSAEMSLRKLQTCCERIERESSERVSALMDAAPFHDGASANTCVIATVIGRYYAMDRDARWERLQPAWRAMVEAQSEFQSDDALAALSAAYARGENDEFVQPTVIDGGVPIRAGDAVVFMNFRADRARQLASAFVRPEFQGFDRGRVPSLSRFVCLTEYSADLPAAVAYRSSSLRNTLPEVLAQHALTQLRIAETEKYAHVTFFFSGGVEREYPGESRILVPSPKVATYDLQPEMSCPELTERLVQAIRSRAFDVIVCNIANPDMVGHTGVLAAAIQAVEAVDVALGAITAALREVGGEMLLTADHGNLELMRDPDTGQPHTQHTTGPVPLVYFGRPASLHAGGALKDVAPSLLHLLGLPVPAEMEGRSLLQFAE